MATEFKRVNSLLFLRLTCNESCSSRQKDEPNWIQTSHMAEVTSLCPLRKHYVLLCIPNIIFKYAGVDRIIGTLNC